ncbi:MAG: hypothetical protein PGN09_09595 [Sphingomonas fennica]
MGATSLSKQAGFAGDTAKAAEKASPEFDPTRVDLGRYGLTAYARSGLVAKVAGQDGGRNYVEARVTVRADGGGEKIVQQRVSLYGPRDVIGIDPAQIVRREPAPGALVGYGGTLAHVEFDKPELPWAFSPGLPAGGRLRPWIALVVVEYDADVSLTLGQGGLPPVLSCPAADLPPLAESWAWAHAQVMGGTYGLAARLTDDHGAQNLSRLICPRRLEDGKTWLACVVPTYAAGRDAGLGRTTFGEGDAWVAGADVTVQLPVYDHWYFTTDVTADFEELARRLKPVVAPAGVGRRSVDVSTPRGGLKDDKSPVQTLDCALHSPLAAPGATVAWSAARTAQLQAAVDAGSGYSAADTLPRVSPRLYAQFQRGQAKVGAADPKADWFAGLNLDPLARVAAGLGTRVVRRDQEPLMRNAWAQVGEIEAANRALAAIQFGRFVGEAMVAKTIAKARIGPLAQMTAAVHGKIGLAGDRTVAGAIGGSVMPRAATSAAFRRMTAPGGRIAQASLRLAATPTAPFARMLGTTQLADLRRPYREPDGIAAISAAGVATLPAGPLRARIADAGITLAPVLERIAAGRAQPAAAIDVVAEGARRREAALRTRIEGRTLTPGQYESLGGVLAGIATVAPADLARSIDQTLARFETAVPAAAAAAPVRGGIGTISPDVVRGGIPVGGGLVGRGGVLNRGLAGGGAVVSGGTLAGRTPAAAAVTPRQRFLTFAGTRATVPSRTPTMTAARIAGALQGLVTGIAATALPATPDRPASGVDRDMLLAGIDPVRNAIRYAKARVTLPGRFSGWFDDRLVRPVMAAPRIERPMFEALLDYDRDWLVPGLNAIAETDFVTLLLSNNRFIEAYMAGLSDEMGRELLWRGYPTDQRGTYFRRFWSRERDELADDIHRWARTPLGRHYTAGATAADGAERVVLMIRGALIRKVPHALVVACKGTGEPKNVAFASPPASGEGSLLFRAALDADTLLVGFDLTAKQIADRKGQAERWWFVLAEHPTAPRFGLDIPTAGNAGFPGLTDDLDWQDLPMTNGHLSATPAGPYKSGQAGLGWGTDAARMAAMLLQKPVRAAFDAAELVGKIQQAGAAIPSILTGGVPRPWRRGGTR